MNRSFSHIICLILFLGCYSTMLGQINNDERPSIIERRYKDKKAKSEKDKVEKTKVKKKESLDYQINLLIEDADFYFEVDEAYDIALELYLEANELDSLNAKVHLKIGVCYIYTQHPELERSIYHIEKSFAIDPSVDQDIHYYLGLAYHVNSKWKKAIANYKNQLTSVTISLAIDKDLVRKKVSECETAITLIDNPQNATIKCLNHKINSKFSDFCPVLSADESTLYFTSRRVDSNTGISNFHTDHYEDIYYCKKGHNNNWSAPAIMGNPFNSRGHDATACMSPDGNTMIIYRDGDLFESYLNGKKWSKPERMPKNINSKYQETSACFSPDGQTLYFVSNRKKESFGGLDIFKSERMEDGSWGKATNLGDKINSSYDEEGVFIHPNGKEMYFSSEGHNSIGGFDLFKSTLNEQQNWSDTENLGFPVNSPGDDVFLVLDKTGKHGFYTSSRKGGLGNKDIYEVNFKDDILDKKPKGKKSLIVAGF